MLVAVVVPARKARHPGVRRFDRSEGAWIMRAVLAGKEQTLCVGIIIAHAGAAVGRFDPEFGELDQVSGALHGATVILVRDEEILGLVFCFFTLPATRSLALAPALDAPPQWQLLNCPSFHQFQRSFSASVKASGAGICPTLSAAVCARRPPAPSLRRRTCVAGSRARFRRW